MFVSNDTGENREMVVGKSAYFPTRKKHPPTAEFCKKTVECSVSVEEKRFLSYNCNEFHRAAVFKRFWGIF